MITKRQIQEVTDIIVEEIQPEKVFLFGSYASGEADKNSDLDIIVIVNEQLKKEARINAMVKLNLKTASQDLLFPKDFKMYSLEEYAKQKENKFSFLHSALKNAKILYERK